MYRTMIIGLVMALPLFARAETPLSAAEFEAYSTGKTLTYGSSGFAYGIEEYFEDRKVRWAFVGGECQEGKWYPLGDMICFVYEEIGLPQCWTFYKRAGGLLARFENDPETTELVETQQSRDPLMCLGPTPGV